MSRSITIGGVERANLTRLESFSFQETAYRGEAGTGGFDVDSEAGAAFVSAWKDVIATDSDGGQFFTGQTVDRGVGRGSFTTDSDAAWDVQVIDINTIMDDVLLRGADCNRPAETDVERMTWLITDYIAGLGGFPTIGDDYLSAANAEGMDAQDYRKQGVYPRSVADECAENSGKNWYLFYDVGVTDQLQIWYGREALTTRTCAYGISSVLSDIDDYGTTWPAEWPEESGIQRDPSRVYSAVQVVYGDPPTSTYVTRPATVTAFKRREAILYDASVKTEAKAIKLGEHYLDAAETEDLTITVAVTVPVTHVNAFLAGQRIPVRFPHLGYDSPTYMRCRTRTVEPAGEESKAPNRYRVTLVLKPTTKITSFGGRPINDVPGQGDNPGGGTPTEPAETTTVGCVSAGRYQVDYTYHYGGTDSVAGPSSGLGGDAGSSVYYNIAWDVCGCPIGLGGWEGWSIQETWWQFTAPADSSTYLGLSGTIDLTSTHILGTPGGYEGPLELAYYPGAVATVGLGGGIGAATPGTVVPFYIPRNLVSWGAVGCIIVRPAWTCEKDAFYCDDGSTVGVSPLDDGRGNSGTWRDFLLTSDEVCALEFATGATGLSGWVAGLGDTDGLNAVFELIGWTGTGTVEASINGLIQPNIALTIDGGAGTVAFDNPPPPEAIVLFNYDVST